VEARSGSIPFREDQNLAEDKEPAGPGKLGTANSRAARPRSCRAPCISSATGANFIGSIAAATERAAGEFDTAMPQAAQYIRQASEQIQSVADVVRERDMRELVGEVENFARRQPTLFFGGAMILGFAALRFLKSSAPRQGSSNDTAANGFEQRRAS
jgi:hypothetical protein